MAKRKRTKHPGVTIVYRRDIPHARWLDPDTGDRAEVSLKKLGFTSVSNAMDWLGDKSREIQSKRARRIKRGRGLGGSASWEDVIIPEFLKWYSRGRSEKALSDMSGHLLAYFREYLTVKGVRLARALKLDHLSEYTLDLEHLSPRTQNKYRETVKMLLKWCLRREFIAIPWVQIEEELANVKQPRKLPRILSTPELHDLITACVKHDGEHHFAGRRNKHAYWSKESEGGAAKYSPVGPFVYLCLLTGMRPGEALALKWDDVNLRRKELRVWGNKTQVERIVPLNDSPALRTFFKTMPRSGTHVLGDNTSGGPRTIARRTWVRLCEMAELPGLRQNELRKTCISAVASGSNYSEYLLEARFGHSHDVSVRHYRQAMYTAQTRGKTVEEWLGVKDEVRKAITSLG